MDYSVALWAVGTTVKSSCVSREFPLEGTIDFLEVYVNIYLPLMRLVIHPGHLRSICVFFAVNIWDAVG